MRLTSSLVLLSTVILSSCTQNITTSLSFIEGKGNRETIKDEDKTEEEERFNFHAKVGAI